MNVLKINKSFTLNIYAFCGYIAGLIHIITYCFFQNIFIYMALLIFFSYYYILLFTFIFLPVSFLVELIIHKKFIWQLNEEYKNNRSAVIYFVTGILLNFVAYIIIYKILRDLSHLH